MKTHYVFQAGQIFTMFLIMLGPVRLFSHFGAVSASLNPQHRWPFAIKTASISALILILAGFLGARILESWQIDPATLLLVAGFLFLLSALHPLMLPEEKEKPLTDISPASVALNLVISPYGLAAVIVLFSISREAVRYFTIIGCILTVMILNLLVMALSH